MAKPANEFERNVFINCPFDDIYTALFNAIVFAIHDVGFRPRCALEASNAGQVRLDKILNIIAECRYSIHDLSRTDLDQHTGLPRFNMPLELGLDLGCQKFGSARHRGKLCLILDTQPYRYQMFVSDISGQDIYAHHSDPEKVITIVRNWLRLGPHPQKARIPGGPTIIKRYRKFQLALPALCARLKLDPKELPFADFSFTVATWVRANPF